MSHFYFEHLQRNLPELPNTTEGLLSDKLISPFTLRLPKKILGDAENVVRNLFALREQTEYQSDVQKKVPSVAQRDPGNKSICMSYDFHLDSQGELKLIEVNTNAAFLLMGFYLYGAKNLPLPIPSFSLDLLRESWAEEARLAGHKIQSIAIVDDAPESQRLFIEFLVYRELFKSFGYEVQIADPKELSLASDGLYLQSKKIDFVYNRTTDFYFENPSSDALRQAYIQNVMTLSPTPFEYSLLADKHRLIEWSLDLKNNSSNFPNLLNIASHLLEADFVTKDNAIELWSRRKKLFFKPLTSFGSKGTYRGEGISRTYFDQLIDRDNIAQEYCPAQERFFEADGIAPTKLKFDLRFYAYQETIQMVVARLYQGQVTNLKTTHGGFAPVIFE